MLRSLLRIIVSAMVLMPGLALAHPGHPGDTGFIQGFIHPLNGIDHLLAMIAVGLLAARLGGRALWLVPISFLSMMAAGAILGALGCAMPFVQIGVAGSVVALGTAAALKRDMP